MVDEPKVPLLLSKSKNLFKLFSNDVGLLAAQYGGEIQIQILQHETTINFGSIYENVAAEELTAHGFTLYYYNSKKFGELDFVIEAGGTGTGVVTSPIIHPKWTEWGELKDVDYGSGETAAAVPEEKA